MKQPVSLNALRYHSFNVGVIVMNYLLVRFAYNKGLYGEMSQDLDELMQFFVKESLFNPIDLLFIIGLGIVVFVLYRRNPHKEIVIDWQPYRIIFVSIILIGIVLLALLYMIRNEGGSILIAWLLIFLHPALLNYVYVAYCRQRAEISNAVSSRAE